MKLLSAAQCDQWWAIRCPELPSQATGGGALTAARVLRERDLPASVLYPLAQSCVSWLWTGRPDEVLIWVREHGVWASSENLHLYSCWRRCHGGPGELRDEPGHLLASFEREEAASLVFLGLAAGWTMSMASPQSGRALNVDHDGKWLAYAAAPGEAARGLATMNVAP